MPTRDREAMAPETTDRVCMRATLVSRVVSKAAFLALTIRSSSLSMEFLRSATWAESLLIRSEFSPASPPCCCSLLIASRASSMARGSYSTKLFRTVRTSSFRLWSEISSTSSRWPTRVFPVLLALSSSSPSPVLTTSSIMAVKSLNESWAAEIFS